MRKAQKEVDDLNEVLGDNAEKLASTNAAERWAAASAIAKSAQQVFGDHIDAAYVEDNASYFYDLAQGGEAAAAAWEHLANASSADWIQDNAAEVK